MVKYALSLLLVLILNLGTSLTSLATSYCPPPTYHPKPHLPPKHPPHAKPPFHPKAPKHNPQPHVIPLIVKPPPFPKPPIVHPPFIPKPQIVKPPFTPKPPIVKPPFIPKPPVVKRPFIPQTTNCQTATSTITPYCSSNPTTITTNTNPHSSSPGKTSSADRNIVPSSAATEASALPPSPSNNTCPIGTLKLGACVEVLGGLIHIGIGSNAKDACCPVLLGLVDLDAAICLCTTIKAKLLNINIIIPIALQVLLDCGKTLPSGFKCPS